MDAPTFTLAGKSGRLRSIPAGLAVAFLSAHVALLFAQRAPEGLADPAAVANDALPLQATREIRFTTDEGTWISLDVSPDGQRIVFDLLGDLYVLPIAGGRARQITSGMAFDAQPRYSPDGTWIAFTSDRDGWTNVWVADAIGTTFHQVTRHRWRQEFAVVSSPEWTPDGQALVVSERIAPPGPPLAARLVEYDVRTGLRRPLTQLGDDDTKMYLGPALGPDRETVFTAVTDQVFGGFSGALWQIARVNRRTREVTLETMPVAGRNAVRPAVSPDGKYLVYGSPSGDGTGLRLRDLSTMKERWLLRTAQSDVLPWLAYDSRDLLPGSAFTPDSRSFITAFDGRIWRIDVETGQTTPIPFEAEVQQALGPLAKFEYPIHDGPFRVHAIRHPAVSPNGRQVAFSALDRVWIADLPLADQGTPGLLGSQPASVVPRRLTTGDMGEFFAAWSPDGRHVAYATYDDRDGGAIYRAPADGESPPEQLTCDEGVYLKPTYADDGDRIVAGRVSRKLWRAATTKATPDRVSGERLDIVSIPANGGTSRLIDRRPLPEPLHLLNEEFIHRSPQALPHERVALLDRRDGLIGISLDGRSKETLIRFGPAPPALASEEGNPIEAVLAPGGRHALVILRISYRALLVYLPDGVPTSAVLALPQNGSLPPGFVAREITPTPVDAVGWTHGGAPYYSIGHALFLGDRAPASPADPLPSFRRIDIDLRVPRDRAQGTVLLRGARLLTMRGGEVIEAGDVLIRDGRIVAVGQTGTLTQSRDTTLIDVRGKTILPGYVDVHNHVDDRLSWGVRSRTEWGLLAELAFGVTTIRSPSSGSADLRVLRERALAGTLVAPRVYSVWPPLHRAFFGDGSRQDLARTRQILRRWSEFHDTENIKQYLAGGRRTRQLVVMAAREQRLTATNEGGWDAAMNLTMVLDGYPGFEHPMPPHPLFRDVVELMARSGTIQTHTLSASKGLPLLRRRYGAWERHPRVTRFVAADALESMARRADRNGRQVLDGDAPPLYAAQAARIVAAGGCVGLGSHGDLPGFGAHLELWLLALGGMPVQDVLRVGTWCSADAIGHGTDLGSLEAGKIADLQILDENPLLNIQHTLSIRYVMKDGRLYEADTLDEVWPRKRRLGPLFWQLIPTELTIPGQSCR